MNFVYGCMVSMCLSGGLVKVFILSKSIVVQSKLGFLISRCSHAIMSGLIFMIGADNILGLGCPLIRSECCARCGKFLVALTWLGWFIFNIGENVLAICWYSSCSFIVQGIKYVLYLLL